MPVGEWVEVWAQFTSAEGQPKAAKGSQGQPRAAKGSQGHPRAAKGSQGQPRLCGLAADTSGAPGADVYFMGHTGFEGVRTLGDLVNGALIDRVIRVRFKRVAAADVPSGEAARKAWLDAEVERAVERAELRGSLEESLAHRAALGRRFPHLAASPGKARSASADASASASDVVAVEEEMRAVTEQIAMLQERVYRCEEREELKGGPRRWARVRSLGEARSLLTILFAAAASWRRRAGREGRVASPATLYHPPSAPETLGVLAEADAVLDALKKKPKARPKSRVRISRNCCRRCCSSSGRGIRRSKAQAWCNPGSAASHSTPVSDICATAAAGFRC